METFSTIPPHGGIGLQISINGTATYYAGGGASGKAVGETFTTAGNGNGGLGGGGLGGDHVTGFTLGGAGTANTGGGGGGGLNAGGDGGSGIVIIRYLI
ncbi:MAG: glycine-rich domain-containing protein [Candidatus Paceibacterota bacterium]